MINLNNINFSYLDHSTAEHSDHPEVFSSLNFTLDKGQRIALRGANGSGKSTLMRLIMGLELPDSGEVSILGTPRRVEGDFLEVRRNIGYLFQDSDDQLFCPTVEEDIAFGPLNLGRTHAEATKDVIDALTLLDIPHLRSSITHRLSGGEKRLVALASVIAMKPQVLLLDEPTAGLDTHYIEQVTKFILNYVDTCLISSHDDAFLNEVTNNIFEI